MGVAQTAHRNHEQAKALTRHKMEHRMGAPQGLMQRIIGGGFMLVIGVIMLGFLFSLDIVSNNSGPFSEQLGTIETVLGAALTFAVLGLLALAGSYAYSMFGG